MPNVLLIVAHPDLSASIANAALLGAVRDLPHVTVHDLYAAYPDGRIDVDAEQRLLAAHDVVVFQHPVFWYNTTPLLKQWQDEVLTLGWAFTVDGTASQLAGKRAVVAATTGVPADYYTPEGQNQTTLEALLSSWTATLRLCQMESQPMFKVHGTAFGLTEAELAAAAQDYRELLTSYAA